MLTPQQLKARRKRMPVTATSDIWLIVDISRDSENRRYISDAACKRSFRGDMRLCGESERTCVEAFVGGGSTLDLLRFYDRLGNEVEPEDEDLLKYWFHR